VKHQKRRGDDDDDDDDDEEEEEEEEEKEVRIEEVGPEKNLDFYLGGPRFAFR
jgi:hypothetical protein